MSGPMIGRRGFGALLLGAFTLTALSACGPSAEDSAEVRYRMIVEVDDNGTVRKGSSVWSFALSKPMLALASPYGPKFAGEAVAVDLSGERTLFALVTDQEMLPERHFDRLKVNSGSDRVANIRAIASHRGATAELSCKAVPKDARSYEAVDPQYDCPMLVTFKDIKDPTSVKRVDPQDLSASFGAGVKLKAITVEITDYAVTTGIEKRLEWWRQYADKQLDGSRYNDSRKFSNSLNRLSFSQGISNE